jgi:hypothetical protein
MPKIKNTALLIILLLGLLPLGPASAGSPAEGSLDESLALLFASRSILLGDVDLEEANRAQGALMSVPLQDANDAGEALGHLIHATKQQRNELNDSCRTLKAAYQAEGKTCELQILTNYCEAEEGKLNARLGLLHRLRGDRRKAFTRMWHSLKRSGERVWTAVGPVGRRILRNVGSEAAEVVLSGGSLSGGVIRKIFIKEARNIGEAELNRLLERGVGRFLQSQAALAQAAGVADCTEEKLDQARQQVAGDVGEPEIQKQPDKESQESCQATGGEFDSLWEESIYPGLVGDNCNCSSGDVNVYKNCLKDLMVREGECYEDARLACEGAYQDIPQNISGTIGLDVLHSEAENVNASIVISSESDAVSGSLSYVLKDAHLCTINVSSTFRGTYDLARCEMSGSAELTFIYDGVACASVCGSSPNSEASCPVTRSGSTTWQATVDEGVLRGGIGGENCDPGCVGFMTYP